MVCQDKPVPRILTEICKALYLVDSALLRLFKTANLIQMYSSAQNMPEIGVLRLNVLQPSDPLLLFSGLSLLAA